MRQCLRPQAHISISLMHMLIGRIHPTAARSPHVQSQERVLQHGAHHLVWGAIRQQVDCPVVEGIGLQSSVWVGWVESRGLRHGAQSYKNKYGLLGWWLCHCRWPCSNGSELPMRILGAPAYSHCLNHTLSPSGCESGSIDLLLQQQSVVLWNPRPGHAGLPCLRQGGGILPSN